MNKTTDPKFSILFLGTQMAVGGAQKVLLDQARWFHEHGHVVKAVFFYDRDGLYEKWSADNDFPTVNLNAMSPGKGVLKNVVLILTGLWSLWKLIGQEHYDVIETFTYDSNTLGLPIAWLRRIPVRIATHHGSINGMPRWRENLHTWLINHNIANILIAVSDTTRQKAVEAGIHEDRVFVIPNGIVPVSPKAVDSRETRVQADMKKDSISLLSIGRLVHEKAYDVMIKAINIVVQQFPHVVIKIAGAGPLHSELQGLVNKLGLGDKVQMLGLRDDVAGLMSQADVFVMSSRSEGMPMALLEAMSTGLPIIATRVGGIEEVVRDNLDGILVHSEYPEELAEAILKLIHDPTLRLRLGKSAHQRIIERYTIDHMCTQYAKTMLNLYQAKKWK